LLANLIILPAQPAVMILGGLATLSAMVFQPLGQVIAWVAWAFLEFTILVVQAAAQIPFAAIDVGRFDGLILAAYYLLLFIATQKLWLEQFSPPPKTPTPSTTSAFPISPAFVLGIALIAGVWIGNLTFTIQDNKTHIEFLDSGGAATFVRTPNGARVLIDGGASPSAILSALGERMPFWDRTIDIIVVTNFDDAHFAGLDSILERFAVRQIIQVAQPKDNAATRKWNDLLAQKNIPMLPAQPGLQINLDEHLHLRIAQLSEDARCAAMQISAANTSLLLADSANIDDQDTLSAQAIDQTVVVVPRTLARDFFSAVNPQFAIVFSNDTPLSTEFRALMEGSTILDTGTRGTIEFIVDGQRLAVRTER
jgi:competence protein ComEC